jgi:hypothetical protein
MDGETIKEIITGCDMPDGKSGNLNLSDLKW